MLLASLMSFLLPAVLAQSPEDLFWEEKIALAVEQRIFDLSEDRFEPNRPITRGELEKAFSNLACKAFPLSLDPNIKDDQPLHKSAVVDQIAQIFQTYGPQNKEGAVVLPPDFEIIYFLDLQRAEPHEKSARLLAAYDILLTNGGYFGTPPNHPTDPDNPDPLMSRFQTLQLLARAFDFSQCGFVMITDKDGDRVEDRADHCPDIPAQASTNGCPKLLVRSKSHKRTPVINVLVPRTSPPNLRVREQTDIRLGDVFQLLLLHPKTNEIFEKSNLLKVTQ